MILVFMRREALAIEHERRRQEEVERLRSEARFSRKRLVFEVQKAEIQSLACGIWHATQKLNSMCKTHFKHPSHVPWLFS